MSISTSTATTCDDSATLQRVHESGNSASVWSCVCLECYKTPCVLWGKQWVFCLKQKVTILFTATMSANQKPGIKSRNRLNRNTWKIRFLLNVAPEHEANKMPVAEDDVCGGKNRKSIVFFSQLWLPFVASGHEVEQTKPFFMSKTPVFCVHTNF